MTPIYEPGPGLTATDDPMATTAPVRLDTFVFITLIALVYGTIIVMLCVRVGKLKLKGKAIINKSENAKHPPELTMSIQRKEMKIISWFCKRPKSEYIPSEDRWWHYPLFALCFLVVPTIAPLILFDLLGTRGAGIISLVLVVMAGIMVSWYGTIQNLQKELDYTQDKLNYYQSAWDRLRYKCPPSDKKEWYQEYFCDRCYQDQGRYWPPSHF